MPTRARARRCRTRWSRCGCTRRSTPRSRSGAATTATCSPRRRRWRRASPSTPTRCRDGAAGRAAAVRSDAAILATAIPGAEDDGDAPAWSSSATRGSGALHGRLAARCSSAAAARLRAGAADHRAAGLAGLLPAAPRHARARPRGRGRGARTRSGARAAATGRGRGSSVSSIVCYLTGLSHVDPIANELLIGRFLNEELTSLPDIDLDFPRDIREQLIPRVHERYGRDRSALVAAFPTYRARGAIRELGKALGLPPGEIERVARGSEGGDAREVGQGHRRAPSAADPRDGGPLGVARAPGGRGARAPAPPVPALGRDGHRHPAADRLLPDRARGDGGPPDRAVGQGLLLGRGLSEDRPARAGDALGGRAVRGPDSAHARREHRSVSGSPTTTRRPTSASRRPTRPGCSRSRAARRCSRCTGRGRETLQDLTIQVAIVRPGPIQGGAVNPYIERLQRLRVEPDYQVPYEHPSLEPALRETLGTIIFQDQVIEVAMAFAGFSAGEAEGLRRAMSRKRSEAAIESYHRRFVEGACASTESTSRAPSACSTMVKGFSGFGFPKAHGAAFGLLAYQSTWLRVHYGPELLCSLLNEQPMGFYPPDALVHESQRRGIEVLRAGRQRERGGVRAGLDGPGAGRARLRQGRARTGSQGAGRGPQGAAGASRASPELASRAGAGSPSLELLAWSGACDASPAGGPAARSPGGAVAARRRGARRRRARRHPARAPARSPRAAQATRRSRRGNRCSPTTARPG